MTICLYSQILENNSELKSLFCYMRFYLRFYIRERNIPNSALCKEISSVRAGFKTIALSSFCYLVQYKQRKSQILFVGAKT